MNHLFVRKYGKFICQGCEEATRFAEDNNIPIVINVVDSPDMSKLREALVETTFFGLVGALESKGVPILVVELDEESIFRYAIYYNEDVMEQLKKIAKERELDHVARIQSQKEESQNPTDACNINGEGCGEGTAI